MRTSAGCQPVLFYVMSRGDAAQQGRFWLFGGPVEGSVWIQLWGETEEFRCFRCLGTWRRKQFTSLNLISNLDFTTKEMKKNQHNDYKFTHLKWNIHKLLLHPANKKTPQKSDFINLQTWKRETKNNRYSEK